jgi:hypothetical protein
MPLSTLQRHTKMEKQIIFISRIELGTAVPVRISARK